MGTNRQFVAIEPVPGNDTDQITATLTDWDLDTETTTVVNGWAMIVGLGTLSPEGLREVLADFEIATMASRVLAVTYFDSSVSCLGYLYESNGDRLRKVDSLTEREYCRAEVYDYFKREHGVDAGI